MSHRLKILDQIKKENKDPAITLQDNLSFKNLYTKIITKEKKFDYKNYYKEYTEKEKKLLNLRKEMNLYKPGFRRYKSKTIKRISESWRKPKGLQNKCRIQKKGTPAHPKIGYSKPRKIRNFNEKGTKEILIYNKTQLLNLINEKKEIMIVLAKKLGFKKKLELENICKENSLYVKNKIKIKKYI